MPALIFYSCCGLQTCVSYVDSCDAAGAAVRKAKKQTVLLAKELQQHLHSFRHTHCLQRHAGDLLGRKGSKSKEQPVREESWTIGHAMTRCVGGQTVRAMRRREAKHIFNPALKTGE